jgi:hypothetical protein
MWIIQEPKKVTLWNKRHFEEKNGECATCLKYSVLRVGEKIYIKCNIWRVAVRPSYIWDAGFLKVKNTTHALCFKIHIKTQSLFKTLECLRLLCHPTCFGHALDHLQGMFLVQCCFPPCCFVTNLLGYVAVSSICALVMCTSLLSVQRGTLDNSIDWRYGHIHSLVFSP